MHNYELDLLFLLFFHLYQEIYKRMGYKQTKDLMQGFLVFFPWYLKNTYNLIPEKRLLTRDYGK